MHMNKFVCYVLFHCFNLFIFVASLFTYFTPYLLLSLFNSLLFYYIF